MTSPEIPRSRFARSGMTCRRRLLGLRRWGEWLECANQEIGDPGRHCLLLEGTSKFLTVLGRVLEAGFRGESA